MSNYLKLNINITRKHYTSIMAMYDNLGTTFYDLTTKMMTDKTYITYYDPAKNMIIK